MKLVMTLRVRDEADVLDQQLSFHLNAGVDFVVALDHCSEDGSIEILERYARAGQLHLLKEKQGPMDESAWATRLARLAVDEFGADWVIAADADEFYVPRGESLKDVLAAIPERYGVVRALLRQFPPRPDDSQLFAERMTARVSPTAPINDPTNLFRPNLKSIHRAEANVTVSAGAHTLLKSRLVPMRGWYPVELLHFPIRSFEQFDRKYEHLQSSLGTGRNAYYEQVHRARQEGRLREFYEELVIDDAALRRGVADGSLVIDTRLRDALRTIADGKPLIFARPSVVDEASYAVDVAAIGEADVVRLQRRLDTLEQRLNAMDVRPTARAYRRLTGAGRKLLGRR